MQSILIACGDTELLRRIVGDLPDGYKPVATRAGQGVALKLVGRGISLAIVHEALADMDGATFCDELVGHLEPAPQILFLFQGALPTGTYARSLKYPVPGPVLRNALASMRPSEEGEQDLDQWRDFYHEMQTRIARLGEQNYYQILGVKTGAPHHALLAAFDALSLRYHPDRYQRFRAERWGEAVYQHANQLYTAMTEAMGVLADRKSRRRYDELLEMGELRLGAEDSQASIGPRSLVDYGTTAPGKKFLKLAQTDIARRDFKSALQNLQFASSMEDHPAIEEKIAEIKAQLKEL